MELFGTTGRQRREWLEGILDRYIADPANRYLGPTGVPQRANNAMRLLEFTDAGDMPAAADAGRRLWNDPSIGNAAEYAAAGAAMMLPMYSARMGEGIADLADDARRFWADEEGAVPLWGGGMSDPTQTGWTFRDVDSSLNSRIAGKENMRVEADTSRIETLPIRQLYATQGTVNPDFATTTSSAGELPLVVRKDGRMYVRDGHHRIVRASEEGAQNIRSRFIDLDGRDTSAPLFDYDPSAGKWTSEDDLLLAELLAPVDPATERAQDILDLLTSGRASEVTDDMLDLGDPVQNARLNMYLFDNYDLPMDEASRMARAREMGLRGGWYRGAHADASAFTENPTGRNFVTFGPPEGTEVQRSGTFFSDNPAYADEYAASLSSNGNVTRPDGAVVGAYSLPRTQPLPDPYNIKAWAEDVGDDAAYEEMRWSGGGWEMLDNEAGQAVKRYSGGHPAFRGAYEFEEYIPSYFSDDEIGGNTAVVFDPRNIRSRFARFDPRLAHLRNLSAGLAGTGILAPVLMQDDDR